MKQKKIISFEIPTSIDNQIKHIMEKKGQTKSAVIREALWEYMHKND